MNARLSPTPLPPPRRGVRKRGWNAAAEAETPPEPEFAPRPPPPPRGDRLGAVLLILGLGAAGCSRSTPTPPPPAPEEARTALRVFLEAWQRGDGSQQLVGRRPAIHGREPEWSAGARLIEFDIAEEGAPFGNSYLVRARLTVQRRGARRQELLNVLYAVTSGDPIWIVRE